MPASEASCLTVIFRSIPEPANGIAGIVLENLGQPLEEATDGVATITHHPPAPWR